VCVLFGHNFRKNNLLRLYLPEMDTLVGENYLISKAKEAQEKDPFKAKSLILTAKTLYPLDFGVQVISCNFMPAKSRPNTIFRVLEPLIHLKSASSTHETRPSLSLGIFPLNLIQNFLLTHQYNLLYFQYEAYELEKSSQNYVEAANIFTYIVLTFQANDGLASEIKKLTEALRNSSTVLNEEQRFYVKMFHYLNFEIQHKILLSASTSSNNVEHLMILLKKFNSTPAHAPLLNRLIETLIAGPQFREILPEALPLIFQKAPDLPVPLVNRILVISFEHYISQMSIDVSWTSPLNFDGIKQKAFCFAGHQQHQRQLEENL
jgi:hypothetical protein